MTDSTDYGSWVWPFSEAQIQAIVNTHNDLRRKTDPEAADMMKMVWDEELAQLAQDWSEQCIFDHPKDIDYGQNLATHGDVLDAINAWYSEYKDYDYDTNTCNNEANICGHYTQLVWANSYQVGCGIHECGFKHITTCNYRPPGNYPGVSPYKNGHYCSLCSYPSWCEEQLCNPSCKDENRINCECHLLCLNCGISTQENCTCTCKPGWSGLDCSEPCADNHKYCWNGWYPHLCDDPEWYFVEPRCPLMCGACNEGPYDPKTHCCDGKLCKQGLIDGRSCECKCHTGYGEKYECDEHVVGRGRRLWMKPKVLVAIWLMSEMFV
ncbi:GLIPR1-like protein 1 [Glandiceps talaboti]